MIEQLNVENFKSLQKLELTLRPLVVLVGPNASGKSNILDALRFVQEIVYERSDISNVLAPRGGYRGVVWGGENQREVSIGVRWMPEREGTPGYALQLGYIEQRRSHGVKRESLELDGHSVVRDSPDHWIFHGEGRYTDSGVAAELSVLLQHRNVWSPPINEVIERILRWAFYHFDPSQMRAPQPVKREYRLNAVGQNLSTVVHALFSDGHPAFEKIFEFITTVVPTAERLLSPIAEGEQSRTYVALQEKGVPTPVGSWGLSDGTLFSLALATALHTPEVPSLLALEAPDTELHPYVMESVAESLVIASRKTQVMVTTHSPYLLNYLPLDSLILVEKVEGKTRCKTIPNKSALRKVIQELGLGKAWYSGHLGGVP